MRFFKGIGGGLFSLLCFISGWMLSSFYVAIQLSSCQDSSLPPDALDMVPHEEPAFINDLLKRMNHKSSVNDIRNGAGVNDLLDPDYEAILYGLQRIHPTQRVVVDVGPFNGMDIAYPAYKRGYTVVSFELGAARITQIVANWKKNGLVDREDFDVIRGPFPLEQPLVGYVNMTDKPHIYLVAAGASDTTALTSIAGTGETLQVTKDGKGTRTWVTRVDEVVSPEANVFLLKTDAEGHDGKALLGASKLMRNSYTIMLEFRPASMRQHGTDPVECLQWLWDAGFQCYDMNTHPGYEPKPPFKGGLARPSAIADFVAWLEHVPKGMGPAGDAMGGWEDLICSRRRPEMHPRSNEQDTPDKR